MLSSLAKWWRGDATRTEVDTEMTLMHKTRRAKALARFKVMTYPQWVKAHDRELGLASEVAYAQYCVRKDTERASLMKG
jgi:hypothetical protein